MRLDAQAFLDARHKSITLLGMSGVGKTTLANCLPKSRWFHYSGDYRIATKYLEEPILDNIKKQAMQVDFLRELLLSDSIYICSNITVHNLAPISTFLGKIGDPSLGGLPVEEFKRRQRLHREAEIGAMRDVAQFIAKAREIYGYDHFVNDAGGSVCELGEPEILELLARQTLIVYLEADEAMEAEMLRRARHDPKPLYYDEAFLDENLQAFLDEHGLAGPEQIEPDAFVQWIFPRLVAHRRPLYQAIAREYGYVVDASRATAVHTEEALLALIAEALDAAPGGN